MRPTNGKVLRSPRFGIRKLRAFRTCRWKSATQPISRWFLCTNTLSVVGYNLYWRLLRNFSFWKFHLRLIQSLIRSRNMPVSPRSQSWCFQCIAMPEISWTKPLTLPESWRVQPLYGRSSFCGIVRKVKRKSQLDVLRFFQYYRTVQ